MSDEIETGASAAPSVDASAASPAPSESSSAPEAPSSRFAALMADDADSGEAQADEASTDGEGDDTAEGETPKAEGEAAPEAKVEPEPDDSEVPVGLKSVLKKHPELRAAHFYKKDLDSLGLSVEEAKEYRRSVPSLEDLRTTVDRAKQLDAFEGLFTHSDPGAPEKFLEGLRMVDEKAADRFVRSLAGKIRTLAPEAYFEITGEAWEKGLAKLEQRAGDDPFRREAVRGVREMLDELLSEPDDAAARAPAPLPNPDAVELKRRRDKDAQESSSREVRLFGAAEKAADTDVRALVAEVVKRRDPDGLITSPDIVEKIVHEVHSTVAGISGFRALFRRALEDSSLPEDQRIAKAAALVRARASNLADLAYKNHTAGLAERIRKASQLKLGKAAKVVSIREATGGRPATTPAPALPRGVRPTSRDIFRASMKG